MPPKASTVLSSAVRTSSPFDTSQVIPTALHPAASRCLDRCEDLGHAVTVQIDDGDVGSSLGEGEGHDGGVADTVGGADDEGDLACVALALVGHLDFFDAEAAWSPRIRSRTKLGDAASMKTPHRSDAAPSLG